MAKMMAVVCLFAVIHNVRANDCLNVVSRVIPCRNYLQNPVPITPDNQCCAAAKNILAGNGDSEEHLCGCLRQNTLGFGFIPSKAQRLHSLCNLAGFSPLVNCLAPSVTSGKATINIPPLPPLLPPLIPGLPPLIPIPPLTPLLPPLTPGLPPLIPIPPANSLLPPLIPIPPVTPLLPPSNPLIPIPPVTPLLPPLIPIPPVTPLLPPLIPGAPPAA
ncbi:lipid-transfer protein [Striga asiatica]|uniref:Lipid-transfer protein n=1 Tax=Striga asiatica TaxID=4170 RepID=A0A5A7QIK7_STRAF|nr:lipid-transfer protein [Striga asiatica]